MSGDEAPIERLSVRDTIFRPSQIPCLQESLITGLLAGTAGWFVRVAGGVKRPTGTFVVAAGAGACARWYMCWTTNSQRDAAIAALRNRQAEQNLTMKLLRQHGEIQSQLDTLSDELPDDDDDDDDDAV